MATEFETRVQRLKQSFTELSAEQRYERIMDLGAKLPPYPAERKTPDRIVPGCQSVLYLDVLRRDGRLEFAVDSEALISKGLAALLVAVYGGLEAQVVLTQPPKFLEECGILGGLSPSRSNGVAAVYLRMRQEALKALS